MHLQKCFLQTQMLIEAEVTQSIMQKSIARFSQFGYRYAVFQP